MKKSFPVHIGGRIYYFDEDAYERLNNYYTNLRQAFTDEDSAEIVEDIELRVSEIIADRHSGETMAVVTITDIDDIIKQMGNPEDISESSHSETTPYPPEYKGLPNLNGDSEPQVRKRLYRNVNDKVIAGVISGLACYWDVNVTALRIVAVVLALCSYVAPLIILYIIGWLLIPAAETPRQILEMKGHKITVGSVGRATILGTPDPHAPGTENNFWQAFGRVLTVLIMSFLGLIGASLCIAAVTGLAIDFAGLVSYLGWGSMKFIPDPTKPVFGLIAIGCAFFSCLIPGIAAIWAACCTLFKTKGVSRRTAIIFAIIEFCLIVAAIAMCSSLGVPKMHIHLSTC